MSEGVALTQELQVRIALPHQFVPRRRIARTAQVTPEPGYETHGIAKLSGRVGAFFFE